MNPIDYGYRLYVYGAYSNLDFYRGIYDSYFRFDFYRDIAYKAAGGSKALAFSLLVPKCNLESAREPYRYHMRS